MSADFFIALMWVSKEAGKDWDNCFISFIPFLCLMLEVAQAQASVSELKSSSKLLFQQSKTT